MDFISFSKEHLLYQLPQVITSYGNYFHSQEINNTFLTHTLVLPTVLITGMVEGLLYRDITLMMAMNHAPGRKNAGIPQITHHSYMQSIALVLPDDGSHLTNSSTAFDKKHVVTNPIKFMEESHDCITH